MAYTGVDSFPCTRLLLRNKTDFKEQNVAYMYTHTIVTDMVCRMCSKMIRPAKTVYLFQGYDGNYSDWYFCT